MCYWQFAGGLTALEVDDAGAETATHIDKSLGCGVDIVVMRGLWEKRRCCGGNLPSRGSRRPGDQAAQCCPLPREELCLGARECAALRVHRHDAGNFFLQLTDDGWAVGLIFSTAWTSGNLA